MAYGSFEEGGITVQSSEQSDEQLAANLAPEPVEVVVESTEEPIAEPVAEVKPKPRHDPKARVEQATAKEAAAKRERDEAKAEADRLRAEIAALKAPKSAPVAMPVTARAESEPDSADVAKYPEGQFDRQYLKDQARWEARQEIQQQAAAAAQAEFQAQRERFNADVEAGFAERYSAVIKSDPYFETRINPTLLTTRRIGVLTPEERLTASPQSYALEEVFHAQHPKEMLEHLSVPEVRQRLATLPPDALRRELVRFDQALGAASPAAPAPKVSVSQAKPPIRPVASSPVAADPNEVTDELDVDEHIKRMNARDRAERRRAS